MFGRARILSDNGKKHKSHEFLMFSEVGAQRLSPFFPIFAFGRPP